MSTPETRLKEQVLRWLKTQKVWVYKTSDRYRSGIPDLLIVKYGHLFAIELKAKDGVVSKIQEHTLKELSEYGAITGVCRTLQEVKCILS